MLEYSVLLKHKRWLKVITANIFLGIILVIVFSFVWYGAFFEVKENRERGHVIQSLSSLFNSLYYIDLRDFSFIELGTNFGSVHGIIGSGGDARERFEVMYEYICKPEYADEMREFCDLTTINERMRNREWLSRQFDGTINGWAEGCFIAADRDCEGNLIHLIWGTRDVNEHRALVFKSNRDELTNFLNRRAYEQDIKQLEESLDKNFVYVSMDINGLKDVNDELGHNAGDELIRGAANCMRETFKDIGRIYRIGGDEFVALLNADAEQIEILRERFHNEVAYWSGTLVKSLSISCGCVSCAEEGIPQNIKAIAVLADKRMYEDKEAYYRRNGYNRRGQRVALATLCALYTKILKIDLKEDSFEIVTANEEELTEEMGYSSTLSSWLKNFAKCGQVHPEDVDVFLRKTDLEYIREYFIEGGKTSLHLFYRRKIKNEFKQILLEVIPVENFNESNQIAFLYIKDIDR